MKVIVLGGYGVFGSRLAELLVRDGHDVVVVGRSLSKARALSKKLGCTPMAVDARAEPDAMFAASPDVVVDAAGPFQAYGRDPYVIPRLCLEHGADYLDLSDDAAFTAGLGVLDDQARGSERKLLSGVSSVPGLSSSIAADLCVGLDEILLIDTAILPGNRAPRGASVISSIIGQLGTSSPVWRGGVWRDQQCWSDSRNVRLAPDLERSAQYIEVPDIVLFPAFFGARSVMFRAGMELTIMTIGMRAVGLLRRRWMFDITPRRTALFQWIANLFLRFGTDRGGMRVAVVGRRGTELIRREWRLIAEAGDGPYIPAVAARAVIRRLAQIAPGARPCLAETTRTEIEQAMADLAVSTVTDEAPSPTLFQAVLADRWADLSPEVQSLHGVQDIESFSGKARVTRGDSLIARLIAWLFGFPAAADETPVTVTKMRIGAGEIWERNFSGRVFRSYCKPADSPYRFRERFWLFNFEMDLPVEDGGLRLPVRRGWFLGIPLPRFLLPKSESREYALNGVFHFDVALSAPFGGGLIVRYRGHLQPDLRQLASLT
ncbi:DUF4166 domain-containing protein [Hoeflea sp. Naph1]|uniref:DUF4166 domain-containing protein n=1 Tax=Hoeflea sp. Naph1 TaxID=3388653 RepID=UPI00398FB2C6